MSHYKYMLRYALTPGHFEEERIDGLVDFCRAAEIDDVMFFVHPMNLSHMTVEETKPWLEAVGRAKRMLAPIGVTTSINPLNTLLHDAVDNTLKEEQPFRLMTDPYGNRSNVVVCPLCPEWRSYIINMYVQYAAVRPYALWVEDDFRFHNHNPLIWGGCFCEEHLREFAREAGEDSIEREAFVKGLLAPSEPHPYRQIWLDCCRRTMVELAREIGQAVHRISPETRVGLMSSAPAVHAAEGRDWHGIMQAFGGDVPAIIRPHLPAYSEMSGISYSWEFNAVSRLTAALIPAQTAMYPELENVPYTAYSKSQAFQKYQLETALLLGCRGITLNNIDMVGNGIYPEENAERWLREEKPFLDTVASFDLHARHLSGVQVLVNERSSYTVHTSPNSFMEGLYPQESLWCSMLSAYGIANRFATGWPDRQGVIALSGQVLRNYGEAEIRELFATRFVLLDGEAAFTLYEMGLGTLCGAARAEWRSVQSYEQIVNGRLYAGIKEGRMRPYLAMGKCLDIRYEQGSAAFVSQIYNVRDELICAGMTVVNNRVFILPYGSEGQSMMLNPIRRAVIQQVLQELEQHTPLMISSYSPNASVYEFLSDDRHVIAIVNNSLDDIDAVEVAGADLSGDDWIEYDRFEPQGRPLPLCSVNNRTVIESRFRPLSMKVLYRRVLK